VISTGDSDGDAGSVSIPANPSRIANPAATNHHEPKAPSTTPANAIPRGGTSNPRQLKNKPTGEVRPRQKNEMRDTINPAVPSPFVCDACTTTVTGLC